MKELTLGERIASLRKKKRLSQRDLANKLFVTRQAVSRWEHDGGMPDAGTLKALSEILGVTVDTLLGAAKASL